MKNIFYKSIVLMIMILFTACGSRIPFVAKELPKNNALVYIYVSDDIGSGDTTTDSLYAIRINSKNIKQKIKMNEYLVFEMKPKNTSISVVRNSIEEHKLELNLKASNIYYLRVDTNLDNDAFSFTQIDNRIASKEIAKTGLAGSTAVEEDTIITEVINNSLSNTKKLSKPDEIRAAYKLKVDGLITELEYKKLKTEILSK